MSAPEPPVTDQVLDQVEATLAGTAIHGRWSKRFTCDMCGREVVYGEQARHAEACGYFIVLLLRLVHPRGDGAGRPGGARPRRDRGRPVTAVLVPLAVEEVDARRYPLAALERRLGTVSDAETALRLGVCRRTVVRWRHAGLTDVQADQVAIRCGMHPALVWPGW